MLPTDGRLFQPSDLFPENGRKRRLNLRMRILSVFWIFISLIFGVSLLVLPWSDLWDNNYLLYLYPQIRPVVTNPFFKGAVIGLGIADLLIGFFEIVRFKGFSRGFVSR